MSQEIQQAIKAVYFDAADPGSFGGINALFNSCKAQGLKVSRKAVYDFLKKEEVYTLHKPIRRHYKRNPIIVGDINKQWQADLVEMRPYSRTNSGYNYILTVIDCFSKRAFAIPLKKKDSPCLVEAFKKLFRESKPQRLQTDKGKEFLNKPVQDLFKENGVHHFVTQNETKAAMVERFNRTLKSRMYRLFRLRGDHRYIGDLQKLIDSYNHSKHRTIGMRPVDVKKANVPEIWRRVYGKYLHGESEKTKFPKQETVRISAAKTVFDKGYLFLIKVTCQTGLMKYLRSKRL
ncbi:MAG: putative uncharacterized transposon-derived protein F54H12.3-like [Ignavibacteria bacterium]|nr:MAG: putative uncharacterized transposon-derived protein F54H12.3-like [Ignavibacteria bacterium]